MSGRERIVEALATVEGITAYPSAPDAPTYGMAWPVWVITRFTGKLCTLLVSDFDVLVLLPAGYSITTVESGDGFMPMVATALSKVGTVQTAEPVAVQIADSSTVPALRIRVTPREA